MSFLRDLAAIAGFGLLIGGCWTIYPPLACIVGGFLLLSGAVIWSAKASNG